MTNMRWRPARHDPDTPGFLAGGGELGARLRAHHWSVTPLGEPSTWPQPLRTLVGVMLAANQPMFIAWGAERTLLYNDGYAPILGRKHPAALGKPFFEVWPEIRDELTPLFDQVFAGEPVHMDDISLVLNRGGRSEEAHFAFSYTPVRDEGGEVAGLFCPCTETTQRVLSERQQAFRFALDERLRDLAEPREVTAAAAEMLGRHLGATCVGYAEADASGDAVTIERDWTAPGGVSVVGRHRLDTYGPAMVAELRAGRTLRVDDVAEDPMTAGMAQAYSAIRTRAFVDAPLIKAGRFAGMLYVLSERPRAWTDNDVALVEEVAERTWGAVERARAEAGLRESRARFGAALVAAQLGTFDWNVRTNMVTLDDRSREIFGFAAGEGTRADEIFSRIDPADVDRVSSAAQASRNTLSRLETEYRIIRPDGSVRTVVSFSDVVAGPDGQAERMLGVFSDATERKRADTERSRLAALVEQSRDFIGIADLEGRALFVNEAGRRLIGLPDLDAVRKTRVVDYFTPEDQAVVVRTVLPAVASEGGWEGELAFRNHATGASIPVRYNIFPVRDAAGAVVGYGTVTRDLTERKRAGNALRASEAKFQAIVDSIDQMIWSTLPDGHHDYFNQRWYDYTGVPEGSTDGEEWNGMFHPDDQDRAWAVWRHSLETGEPYQIEYRLRHRSGRYRWVIGRAQCVRDDAGRITRWFGTCTDIEDIVEAREVLARSREELERLVGERTRELEQAHEALRQAQKMEAVGQLTGGIAHDFNNLLTGVIGSLDMMQRRIAQGRTNDIERYATAAMTSANRAAALTHRLLAFSRRQPLDPKPVGANRLVTGMEELLRRTIGEAIRLEIVTAGGLWLTLCDPHQLENAILNLAINARDAMPDGGKLTIETCNAHLDSAYAAKSREVRPGQYICICVTDTGTGMSGDVIAKAFDPFFTTKPIGQGTGLGLSMIYGFARQSEGYAKIYSEVGRGTTVKLYLPRYYGEAAGAEEAAAVLSDEHRAEHGEVVLVVEDETAVRDLVTDVLEELGYRAVEAADGPAGLKLLQSDMRIDLLVTDVGLPGLNGRQLADAARAGRPDLKVLFMTGYAENATIANGFLEPGMQMITKPFAIEALTARIRDIIEEGR